MSYLVSSYHVNLFETLNSADSGFLHHSIIKYILKLRLLSKSWAIAIGPFGYRSLCPINASMTKKVLQRFVNGFMIGGCTGLRQLSLDRIMYQTDGVIDPVSNACLDVLGMDVGSTWLSMQEAAQLITLCGRNITDLKLSFKSWMGFSKNMLDAIGDSLDLRPGSLRNLSHLWLATYPENRAALTRFCKDVAMDVKIFECLSPENREDIAPMIVSLRNSIEILFLECIPDNLPSDLCTMYFPKLTVL
ncbi:uncharacterized protein MELLADRAFT_102613 [Melampsora larici-populina 98AG31]|uniref:F-box domain-containing protein n=1 Tax=Melampsora larici-populina (strain 98AG31 / pathotype 3-4-7) TaxID=747676 RepID=F4R8U2_MELLP|nr:uncharacterized protein MELLADRAFT_102613 [Melampsora larici-populina 98AG31]EGG11270.1 hypothetical protein MELLADRAFT_102613 [Melampsora larici-populina 98AG31]